MRHFNLTIVALAALTFIVNPADALAQDAPPSFTDDVPVYDQAVERRLVVDAWRHARECYRAVEETLIENPYDDAELRRRIGELERAIADLERVIGDLTVVVQTNADNIEDIQELIAALEVDLAILEGQLDHVTRRVAWLERYRSSGIVGANCTLGLAAPIPGITPMATGGCGLWTGLDIGNEREGWMFIVNPELTLPIGGYGINGYGIRYWRNRRGNLEGGTVLGGGANFFDAIPGPKYSAFQGGLHAGGYGALRISQNRRRGSSTWIGLVPVLEAGAVGSYTHGGAMQASGKVKLVIFKRKRFNVPYYDANPEALQSTAAPAPAVDANAAPSDGAAYILEDLDDGLTYVEPEPVYSPVEYRQREDIDVDWDLLPEDASWLR